MRKRQNWFIAGCFVLCIVLCGIIFSIDGEEPVIEESMMSKTLSVGQVWFTEGLIEEFDCEEEIRQLRYDLTQQRERISELQALVHETINTLLQVLVDKMYQEKVKE